MENSHGRHGRSRVLRFATPLKGACFYERTSENSTTTLIPLRELTVGRRDSEIDFWLYPTCKRLIDDAISFSQFLKCGNFVGRYIRVKVEAKPNILEADRRSAVDTQGAAEVQVSLRINGSAS